MKRLQTVFIAAALLFTTMGAVGVVAAPSAQAASGTSCEKRLLTFPVWYRGVYDPATCEIVSPDKVKGGLPGFIWQIALNIIEIALQAVGYLAAAYIIWGGYKYIISTGNPGDMANAKKTILNAIIGLVISIGSVGIVNLIAGALR